MNFESGNEIGHVFAFEERRAGRTWRGHRHGDGGISVSVGHVCRRINRDGGAGGRKLGRTSGINRSLELASKRLQTAIRVSDSL